MKQEIYGPGDPTHQLIRKLKRRQGKRTYICPCCESNPADIIGKSEDMIQMLCVQCGHIAIRKSQKKTLRIWI